MTDSRELLPAPTGPAMITSSPLFNDSSIPLRTGAGSMEASSGCPEEEEEEEEEVEGAAALSP